MYHLSKQLPIDVLNELIPVFEFADGKVFRVERKQGIFYFQDNDVKSDFFFSIEEFRFTKELVQFHISYKPKNTRSLEKQAYWIDSPDLMPKFALWMDLMQQHEKTGVSTIDKVLVQYENEFLSEFGLKGKRGNDGAPGLEQQLFLYAYLSNTIQVIEDFRNSQSGNSFDFIYSITVRLQQDLPKLTKIRIAKSLAYIWGMCRKTSLELFESVYNNEKEDVITQFHY